MGELCQQASDRVAHFGTVDNHINSAVIQQKFGTLEAFRQLLANGLFGLCGDLHAAANPAADDATHNRQMAEARVDSANQIARRYFHFVGRAKEQARAVNEQALEFEGWEVMENKRPHWEAQQELERLRSEAVGMLGEAEAAYLQALAYEPDNKTARQGLARLYWTRLEEAEERGDSFEALYYKNLVARNNTGAFDEQLRGDGQLKITTEPPGLEVELERLQVQDRIISPAAAWSVGRTPVELPKLTMGRYRARINTGQNTPLLTSFAVERSAGIDLHIRVPQNVPDDFIFVSPGPALIGDDNPGSSTLARQHIDIGGFLLARYPVTMAEYLEFINALERTDPAAAIGHMPRTRGAGILCQKSTNGHYEPIDGLIVGPARQRYPHKQGHEWFLPVFGISWYDAQAYIAWRSQRDNRIYRLPDEIEWEKAARGGDGRRYPWGDVFEASFCKSSRSRPEPAQPEPVGTFPQDCSPFGVRDMAGGIGEWTRSLFTSSGSTYDERAQHDPEMTSFERVCRGGSWNTPDVFCAATFRTPMLPSSREPSVGFRLAMDVPQP